MSGYGSTEIAEALEACDQIELLRDSISENFGRLNNHKAAAESRILAKREIESARVQIRAIRAKAREIASALRKASQS